MDSTVYSGPPCVAAVRACSIARMSVRTQFYAPAHSRRQSSTSSEPDPRSLPPPLITSTYQRHPCKSSWRRSLVILTVGDVCETLVAGVVYIGDRFLPGILRRLLAWAGVLDVQLLDREGVTACHGDVVGVPLRADAAEPRGVVCFREAQAIDVAVAADPIPVGVSESKQSVRTISRKEVVVRIAACQCDSM